MNRIILIGNGFDLAHGLETSYRNFIDDYWCTVVKIIMDFKNLNPFENDQIKIHNVSPTWNLNKDCLETKHCLDELKKVLSIYNEHIIYDNDFLKVISEESRLKKWVDVEDEYYAKLKGAYKRFILTYDNKEIKKLHADFLSVKNLLNDYLFSVEKKFSAQSIKVNDEIGSNIYAPFNIHDFSEEAFSKISDYIYDAIKKESILGEKRIIEDGLLRFDKLSRDKKSAIRLLPSGLKDLKGLLLGVNAINDFILIPNHILLLNFNYTNTERYYKEPMNFEYTYDGVYTNTETLHIHGSINDRNNPMIFGFGDELDEDYKSIENLNNNDFLENIKSINYLDSPNYKNLLRYIESDIYQIFIFGHACGNSDRTLLNTLFEHDNCGSIKVFYHQKKENEDNFSDVIRNISRNFKDKAKMRDRVVNKEYCEPLVKYVPK